MSDQFNKAKDSVQAKADDARAEADTIRDQGEAAINDTRADAGVAGNDARDDFDASIERLRGHPDEQQDHTGGVAHDAMDGAKGLFDKIKHRLTGGD